MRPKISVIVTIYNLENRLEPLLKSIESQLFQDFEVILVDDASSDNSIVILGDFAAKQHLFSVQVSINQSNLGRSASRNKGFDLSRGDFVCFLDGDDMLDENYLEKLYFAIVTNDAEIAVCGYKTLEITTGEEKFFPMLTSKTPNEVFIGKILSKLPIAHCCILFKKDFLKKTGIRYVAGCELGEDVEFALKVFCRVKCAAFVSDCLYVYVQHPQMSMRVHKKNPTVMIERYDQNTKAHMRIAQYILTYATDETIRVLAKHFLLPIAYLRQLSVYAMQKKRGEFKKLLNDKMVRSCLWQSYHSLFAKGEVFARALFVLLFPKIYYKCYSNRYK